ncbi:hypothetical protein CVT25_002387 [Psilocybe cyanescens]|uniref:Uncharacterized protein n=1 Tax=Psilocybe cyanescens TaxID=93625 RepID=A0A409WK54_PSICY|nr:hypothetical protein CVT25_002387 [Psilocybe cyanescens]
MTSTGLGDRQSGGAYVRMYSKLQVFAISSKKSLTNGSANHPGAQIAFAESAQQKAGIYLRQVGDDSDGLNWIGIIVEAPGMMQHDRIQDVVLWRSVLPQGSDLETD